MNKYFSYINYNCVCSGILNLKCLLISKRKISMYLLFCVYFHQKNKKKVINMIKTIRVMLIPNNKQKTKLFQYANAARFAYNWALGMEQEIIKIDTWFPSSQICSNCGYKDGKKLLSIREWTCPKCGTHHDRDINAAINILNEGLRMRTVGTTEIA